MKKQNYGKEIHKRPTKHRIKIHLLWTLKLDLNVMSFICTVMIYTIYVLVLIYFTVNCLVLYGFNNKTEIFRYLGLMNS